MPTAGMLVRGHAGIADEGSNCGQACITGAYRATASGFQIVQKRQDDRSIDIVQRQCSGSLVASLLQEPE